MSGPWLHTRRTWACLIGWHRRCVMMWTHARPVSEWTKVLETVICPCRCHTTVPDTAAELFQHQEAR